MLKKATEPITNMDAFFQRCVPSFLKLPDVEGNLPKACTHERFWSVFLLLAGCYFYLFWYFLGGGFCLSDLTLSPFSYLQPTRQDHCRQVKWTKWTLIEIQDCLGQFLIRRDWKRCDLSGFGSPICLAWGVGERVAKRLLGDDLLSNIFWFIFLLISTPNFSVSKEVICFQCFSLLGHLKYQQLCKMAVLGHD